jgi:hypothetical protein
MKTYDKENAVEAMYELKKQGFTKIRLELWDTGELYLACGHASHNDKPNISIDSTEDWSTNPKDYRHHPAYWWVFD